MATNFAAPLGILNFMAKSPDYGKIASSGVTQRLKSAATQLASNTRMHGSGIAGQSKVNQATHKENGSVATGAAQGTSAAWSGGAAGFGEILGGVADKYGKTASTDELGTDTLGYDDLKDFGRSDADIKTLSSGGFIDHGYIE